jgi:hypothetical protein
MKSTPRNILFILIVLIIQCVNQITYAQNSITKSLEDQLGEQESKLNDQIANNIINISGAEAEQKFYFGETWRRRFPGLLAAVSLTAGLGYGAYYFLGLDPYSEKNHLFIAQFAPPLFFFTGIATIGSGLWSLGYATSGGKRDELVRELLAEFQQETKLILSDAKRLNDDLVAWRTLNTRGFYSSDDQEIFDQIGNNVAQLDKDLREKYSSYNSLVAQKLEPPYSDHALAQMGVAFHTAEVELYKLRLTIFQTIREQISHAKHDPWLEKIAAGHCTTILARFKSL